MLDRDRPAVVADPLAPAELDARLDREPRLHTGRQDLLAVLGGLILEQLPARHRDDAHRSPVGSDLAPRLECQSDLGARPDQDQVGRGRRLPQGVRAALDERRRSQVGAVERWHLLARERERDRAVGALERDAPGMRRLVRVGRSHEPQERDRT